MMTRLNTAILSLKYSSLLAFLGLLVASVILMIVIACIIHDKTKGIFAIVMLASVALPALIWNAGGNALGFVWKFFVCLIADILFMDKAVPKLTRQKNRLKKSANDRNCIKQFKQALIQGDYPLAESMYIQNPQCIDALSEKDDPAAFYGFVEYVGKNNHVDKAAMKELADRCGDDRRVAAMLRKTSFSLDFRACLFEACLKRNGDPEIRGDVDLLTDFAPCSKQAKNTLLRLIPSIEDPGQLKSALAATDAVNNPGVIQKVMPRLTYPEFAEELRKIAPNFKVHKLAIRKQAFDRLPPDDEANLRRYCPFCGSASVGHGYLGLINDMYHYGYKCNGCGHTSGAPEGMGEGTDFTVSLRELCEYASPEVALKNR